VASAEENTPFISNAAVFLFMPVFFLVYLARELSCACEQVSCDAYGVFLSVFAMKYNLIMRRI
jgi:hypothetical protein